MSPVRNNDLQSLETKGTRASWVPLLLAYVVHPLGLASMKLSGAPMDLDRVTALNDALWLSLAGLAVVISILKGGLAPSPGLRRPKGSRGKSLAKITLFLAFAVFLFRNAAPWLAENHEAALPIQEARPLAYLLFAVAWAITFGLPSNKQFRLFGAVTGFMILLDFVSSSIMADYIVAANRMGRAEYPACLLLVSLSAGLDSPAKGKAALLGRGLILAGLMSTFSPTALATGAALLIFLDKSGFRTRLLSAMALLFAAGYAIWFTPEAGRVLQHIYGLRLWVNAASLFMDHPLSLLTGFPTGIPLPVNLPLAEPGEWQIQATAMYVLPLNIHVFWVRFILVWGLAGPLALFAACSLRAAKVRSLFGAGVLAAILAQGLISVLFYQSNVAIILFLALVSALTTDNTISSRRQQE